MSAIKGITIILYESTQSGTDEFNQPMYVDEEVEIENVLVSPSTPDDITTSTDLVGKKAIYTLAIPKGDTHEWEDKKVKFFDETWHVFGFSIMGIEDNIPLDWNRKVMVERYG